MRAKRGSLGDDHSTCAVIIHPFIQSGSIGGRAVASRLEEAAGLAAAINLNVAFAESVSLRKIQASSYFGKGTVERLGAAVNLHEAAVVCVDASLSAVQQRSLEQAWNTKVIDRTGLILEIFGDRATTREGVLQVELAHLTYQRSRLVRTWTHLERQRGGFGFLGGPGETQIEADRRMISERITKIKRELKTVTRTRELHREARRRVPYPTVALVGYTNAGKSTLFNTLTNSKVLAKDLLFATLDPTMRAFKLVTGGSVILSDTVGFVSDLPTTLIAAFRATLEEVICADVIVHVRDISHSDSEDQRNDVMRVMAELGVNLEGDRHFVEVFNKIDLLGNEEREVTNHLAARDNNLIPVSAATGENVEAFIHRIGELISADWEEVSISLPHGDGGAISWLYRNTDVLERHDSENFAELRVFISSAQYLRFQKTYLKT